MLSNLDKERNLYETRQMITDSLDVFGDKQKDLQEHWDDKKLDNWRGKIQLYFIIDKLELFNPFNLHVHVQMYFRRP